MFIKLSFSFAFESLQDGPEGSYAYDPFTGTFLTPQWRNILNKDLLPLEDATTFYSLYRYPRNDPINSAKFNPFAGKFTLK